MACALSVQAQEENGGTVGTMNLTLAKAIEIALAENPTIHVADKEIELKKIADTEAWQSLLPSVDATLSLTNNLLVAEMVTGMGKFKMGVDGTLTAMGNMLFSCFSNSHSAAFCSFVRVSAGRPYSSSPPS